MNTIAVSVFRVLSISASFIPSFHSNAYFFSLRSLFEWTLKSIITILRNNSSMFITVDTIVRNLPD